MIRALYVLRLAKRHILRQSNVEQLKGQAHNLIHCLVMLGEGISLLVS